MILKTAHITKYKCIDDSNSFSIEEDVTCLVGKNEAGKTAALEALHKLKPERDGEGDFDVTKEYFRPAVLDYKQRHDAEPDTAVLTTWQLEDQDYEALETKIGPAARSIGIVTVSKRFDNEVLITFELDEREVVNGLLKSVDLEPTDLSTYESAHSVEALASQLGQPNEEQEQRTALAKMIEERFGDKTPKKIATDIIWASVPRFAFFTQYTRMPGQLSVEDFKKRTEEDKLTEEDEVFTSLLDMIGMSVDEFIALDTYEDLMANLEAAEDRLTRRLRKYWPDGRYLSMAFKFDEGMPGDPVPFDSGKVFRARIKNERYGVTTGFDQRSNGFIWFFSFLVWFTQLQKNYKGGLVVLLDEPGLSLHGTAQTALLRFIDECLAPEYQVMYTSHSLYMLDSGKLHRVRPVEDIVECEHTDHGPTEIPAGTKVFEHWWKASRNTILPLADCVAVDLAPALFVGQYRLLVEGAADVMFIEWFSGKLVKVGRESLDKRWTLTSCQSISKIGAFLNLFGGDHLHCAVVCDFAEGQKGEVRRLRESAERASAEVLTADQYAGKPEADLEDLLGDDCYADLVNRCYNLTGDMQFIVPKTTDGGPTGRIVKAVEEHMRTLPPDVDDFTHPGPADYLMRQGLDIELVQLDAALDRFEALFAALNTTLSDLTQGGKTEFLELKPPVIASNIAAKT